MELTHFIIHRIDKTAASDPVVTLRAALLPVDERVERFTKEALEAFERRTSRIFASFHGDIEQYPFSERCRMYLEGGDFIDLSRFATNLMSDRMRGTAATGGYMIFVAYSLDATRMLLVIMLNKQMGFIVDDVTLELKDSPHLDFSQIDKAATVNGGPGDGAMPDKPLTYAGFRKSLSLYFQEFLGPDRVRDPLKESRGLMVAVDQFFEEQGTTQGKRDEDKKWLASYASDQAAKGEDLDLRAIAARIHPEDPDKFFALANSELGVSALIPPSAQAFKRWDIVEVKTDWGLTMRFAEDVFNDDDKIEYDAEKNALIIHDVPTEVAALALRIYHERGKE